MFTIHRQEIEWGGRRLVLETGKVARQSDGAVIVTYGDTSLLCTAVGEKTVNPEVDFLPLTVHYQEKMYAAGRIPGGFFKREGKPSEREVLTSRLVDRPIRPLFPEDFFHEVQVVCTLLSHDRENDPSILAIIGASAALAISGIPFLGPIAAAKIGYKDNKFILNPTLQENEQSLLDLVVAGTKDGVLMVESEAKELPEAIMLDAVMFAHEHFQPVIAAIEALAKKAGKPTWEIADVSSLDAQVYEKVQDLAQDKLQKAYQEHSKQVRLEAISSIRRDVLAALGTFMVEATGVFTESRILSQFKKLEKKIVRGDLLKKKTRIDGRDLTTVRPIIAEVNVLPRVHGSSLFTRGETQALVVTTLGTAQDEQVLDNIEGESRERFMLHYNFPPYSVGEVGRLGGPGRREVGHGKLAYRAINPLLPSKEKFPYALRVVSEITESNGSSSMATVCGTSLALMDAGVPMKAPAAGIAMGLVKEGKNFVVLSDILGDEDHLGDMDFKVAGTQEGVTALQMDIKVTGITREIMEQALKQAYEGRLHILGEMAKALEKAREDVSANAPKMVTIQINKDKIRDLIGPGGKNIRNICETAAVKVDISEDGNVEIAGNSSESIEKAIAMINNLVQEPEVGMVLKGTVSKLMEFGAIVSFMGDKTGLVHISQLANDRVKTVEDIVKPGDVVWIKILDIDERGKVKLSMKAIHQETGVEKTLEA